MKLAIVSGERPSFIRLVPTIRKCKKYFDAKFIWIDQNFDPNLSDIFFEDFNLYPDIKIKNEEKMIGIDYFSFILPKLKDVFELEKPDVVLVLGDTNASLAAVLVAKKMGICVVHCEAGNRCYDSDRVPEEVNRYMVDAIADWNLCYTQRAREHLLLEGKKSDRTIVIGNPLIEILQKILLANLEEIPEDFILATIHRKENIDDPERLYSIIANLNDCGHKVKLSFHPSLKSSLKKAMEYKVQEAIFPNIEFFEPCNYSEFIRLMQKCKAIFTDSGSIPEEANWIGVPSILFRFSTERPELLEVDGMSMCSNPLKIKETINAAIEEGCEEIGNPDEYHMHSSKLIYQILRRLDTK